MCTYIWSHGLNKYVDIQVHYGKIRRKTSIFEKKLIRLNELCIFTFVRREEACFYIVYLVNSVPVSRFEYSIIK